MHRFFMLPLLAAVAPLGLACGPSASESAPVATIAEPVMGGYVDDEDRGVVGLAIDFQGLWFSGHCSGTLIAPNLVLTARHCVALTQGEGPQGEVVCGQTGFGFQGQGGWFLVSPETQRPGAASDPTFYRGTGMVRPAPGANDICGYDVALIILEGAGIPESVATPVIPRIDSTPEPGDEFSAVGFGLTDPSDNGSSGVRMRRDGNVVSCIGLSCVSLGQVEASEWAGDAPVCPGDSGGPALDAEGRVMGVVSRGGTGCVSSIYGDVGSWKDFVIETAIEAAELGGYDPPFWATSGSSTPPPEPEPDPQADAGTEPDAGTGSDPLGQPCSGACPPGYVCFSRDGQSGICVPPCSAADPECPSDYTCAPEIGACVDQAPPAGNAADAGESGGCALAPAPADPARPVPWVIGALGLAALGRRSRRRS